MKISRWIIVSGTAILAIFMALVLVTGFSQAQEAGQEPDINEMSSNEATSSVSSVIPIQGQLTDSGGSPIDGSRVITFSLYSSFYGITPVCQDDDFVDVDNGLFNAEMDNCTSTDINGKALYLGIQVEGDAEMSPREAIYPVPYAYSLRPGAIISGTTSVAILHIENHHASGRGLRSYAMSETGTNFGVVGASRSPDGYGGYFYNNGGGTALYGKAITETGTAYGVHGISEADSGRGVYGEADNPSGGIGVEGSSIIGSGVYGNSTSGYGIYGSSGSSYGIYGNTNNTSDNYGLFTYDNLYSDNIHTSGAMMQVVQNIGESVLETGDVVAFAGIGTPLEAGEQPVIQVAGAEKANSTAVAGVVFSRFNLAAVTENPDPANPSSGQEITPDGPVAPGEYMLMVVQGPAQVKANALASTIQPGDLLSSASQNGYANKAAEINVNGVNTPVPGTILGKALEPLDTGEALIYIFVTLQ